MYEIFDRQKLINVLNILFDAAIEGNNNAELGVKHG